MVAVFLGGGADRGRVRTGAGLGDRHGRPLALEALQLLIGGDRGDGRVTQALTRHGEQETGVAVAEFQSAQAGHHIGAVFHAAVFLHLALAGLAGAGGVGRVAFVEAVQHRGHHVQLLGALVFGTVVFAGDGPEGVQGHLPGIVDHRFEFLRNLDVHAVSSVKGAGGVTGAGRRRPRRSRADRDTSVPPGIRG